MLARQVTCLPPVGQDQRYFRTHGDSFQKLNVADQSFLHISSIERRHGETTPALNDSNPAVFVVPQKVNLPETFSCFVSCV